jgi:hypothetical protein
MTPNLGRAAAIALGAAAVIAIASSASRARARPSYGERKPERLPPAPTIPAGWKRYRGRVSPALRGAANVALEQHRPIGTLVPLHVEGKDFGAFIEWHDDRTRGRHHGVSLLVQQ